MDLTPAEIGRKTFPLVRRGSDPQEVTLFLERVAMHAEERERSLAAAVERAETLERRLAEAESAEEAIKLTLIAATEAKERLSTDAQRAADEMVGRARGEAEKLRREAGENAEAIVSEARREALRLLEVSRTEAAELVAASRAEHKGLEDRADELRRAIRDVTRVLQGIAGGALADLKMADDRLDIPAAEASDSSRVAVLAEELAAQLADRPGGNS